MSGQLCCSGIFVARYRMFGLAIHAPLTRANTFRTDVANHLPPRAAGTLRALNTVAFQKQEE
jgi:hypothetical protein